jgi:hypothetical protein
VCWPAEGFELISPQEATWPDDPFQAAPPSERAGPEREPEIRVFGSLVMASPFDLTIELHPGNRTATINLDHIQVTYRKKPPVSLLPRLRPYMDSSSRIVVIRIVNGEAPPGRHEILLQVMDSNEQITSKAIVLDVRKAR